MLRADTVAAGELDPAARRHAGHGPARGASGPARRGQDRDDRELRRRLVRRLHAAARHGRLGRLPEQADPDDDRVPRRARGGRHLPRDDLEDVHGEGADASRRPRRQRGAVLPAAAGDVRRVRAGRAARREAPARQRPLPRDRRRVEFLPGGRASSARTASPTRSTCRASSATRSGSRSSASSRSRSRLRTSTSPRSRGSGSTSCSRSTRHTGRCRRTTA